VHLAQMLLLRVLVDLALQPDDLRLLNRFGMLQYSPFMCDRSL